MRNTIDYLFKLQPNVGVEIVQNFNRITFNPNVMGGKACIRGMRVTVGTVVGLVASGYSNTEILNAYPYLEEEDIRQSLSYSAWRVQRNLIYT